MRTENAPRHFVKRLHSLVIIGVFTFLAALVAAPVCLFTSSAADGSPEKKITSQATTKVRQFGSLVATNSETLSPVATIPGRSLLEPAPTAGIATFGADCVTPRSDFILGETVCAKATGVPVTIFNWWVSWVDPVGFIRQRDTAVADDQATYTYTLPSNQTSVVNGQTVDNRGKWRVNLTRFSGAIQATASFTVHDPANPVADVFVQKFQSNPNQPVGAGDNVAFTIVVGNLGPDPAAVVHLVDSLPSGSTLKSFTQTSGPACVPIQQGGVPNDCSIATLTNGDRAEFTAVYGISGSTTPGTVLTTSASVSSTTTDPNPDNNTSTAQFTVQGNGGTGGCTLTCPPDITTQANTTDSNGNRGAVVHFNPPTGQGTCGNITVDHCNDCFFPVGTTVVTATADSGDTCSFDVTVSEVTITCPPNKDVDTAPNATTCEATVDPGSPTITGDNVTVDSSRSDGRPLSDPYPVGQTTITWTATSHDSSGNVTGTASCQQTITVHDKTAPVITCPSNISVTAPTGSCSATVNVLTSPAAATDNCDGPITPVPSRSDNKPITDPFPVGTVTITWTATDSSGNSSSCTQTVVVADNEPPVITCPANITTGTDPGQCSATVNPGTATATDNCTVVTVSGTRSDGQPLIAPYPKGTTTITWTATDASGNQSSCTQTVTVVDNEPPKITFNGNTPSMSPPNHSYHTFTPADFISSVSDNCDTLSVGDVYITKATSDEPDRSGGSGNTSPDIVIATDCKSIQLRAERQGGANGRVYTIYFKLKDSSGNFTTGTAKVIVPVETGGTAVDDGPQFTVTSTCP